MSCEPVPICGEHQISKEWKPTTFEYDEDGVSIRDSRWITHYANNNDWYDDTSDGPVQVTVTLNADAGRQEDVLDGECPDRSDEALALLAAARALPRLRVARGGRRGLGTGETKEGDGDAAGHG